MFFVLFFGWGDALCANKVNKLCTVADNLIDLLKHIVVGYGNVKFGLGRAKLDTSMKVTYFMFWGMLSPNQADTQLYLLWFSQKTQNQRWLP